MIYLFIFLSVIFFAVNYALIRSLLKQINRTSKPDNNDLCFSIVTAAKNEKKNLPELINSIEALQYAPDSYELIIVDDNSSDGTYEHIKNILKNKHNLHLYKADRKIYPAKKGALQIGIEKAKFSYIAVTDADCIIPQGWLATLSESFKNGNDIVFGHAPYFRTNGLVNAIACFENIRSSVLTFGLAGLGMPYSAAARSFAFRKDSFLKINGYKGTLDVVSGDDDLLIREAVRHGLKIKGIIDEQAFVFSGTKENFRDYINQKARHTSTSSHYLLKHKIVLAFWHLMNLLLLFSPILLFLTPLFPAFAGIKLLTDVSIISFIQRKLGYRFQIYELLLLQLVYEGLIIINFFGGLRADRIKWK